MLFLGSPDCGMVCPLMFFPLPLINRLAHPTFRLRRNVIVGLSMVVGADEIKKNGSDKV